MDFENASDARRAAQELINLANSISSLEQIPDPVAKLCFENCLEIASALGGFFVTDDFAAVIGGPEEELNRKFGLLDEEPEFAVELVLNVEADLGRALERLNGGEASGDGSAEALQNAINSLSHLARFLHSVLSR